MNKSVVTIATATSFMLMGGLAQASIRKTSVKPAKLTSKSTFVKGTATKSATIRLSHNHTTYAYGKATNKGKFSLKLKHKLHNSWKYRLTISKKGYKTTTAYLKISATKPASSKNTDSSAVTSSTAVRTASNASSANSSTNSTKPAQSTTTSSATASTPATSATSATSATEKADLALADQYKAKALELSQQASNQSNQTSTIYQILNATVHSADYYAKLDSQINDYQQKIKALSAKSHDTTSNDYQSLAYHLTNLQTEKARAQKNDEYPKEINTLDKSKVAAYKDKFHQSQDHRNTDSDEDSYNDPSEADYFWTLAGKLYNKYHLEMDTDWEDGPYTKSTNTKDEIFKTLVADINNTKVEKPAVDPEVQKQEQQRLQDQKKLQEQYDKDYASALTLVSQYNQNSKKENSLYSEINQMSNNINEFTSRSSADDSKSDIYTQWIKEEQDALDALKKKNPNYENTSMAFLN
ncbi:hypothetical protein IWT25_01714 [Secundilactobacillus pentosiphilus]|uniref:Bacterial Ig domain-containing protein n=1 Tax=Secundilactobacillus pentosiphilus TaxID=1714682 RepID=A0A1Z5IX46_9LACO|nr:hypothetical protein [Secundilactobacillus pentosiphilus]GAX06370.1 hypothetical protein IWT25_01714 [Secundilactobacillus pentosiphilus]